MCWSINSTGGDVIEKMEKRAFPISVGLSNLKPDANSGSKRGDGGERIPGGD